MNFTIPEASPPQLVALLQSKLSLNYIYPTEWVSISSHQFGYLVYLSTLTIQYSNQTHISVTIPSNPIFLFATPPHRYKLTIWNT